MIGSKIQIKAKSIQYVFSPVLYFYSSNIFLIPFSIHYNENSYSYLFNKRAGLPIFFKKKKSKLLALI